MGLVVTAQVLSSSAVVMPHGEWRARALRHRERVVELLGCEPAEAAQRRKDPRLNFIFQYYYGFKPRDLVAWSPGLGVDLATGGPEDSQWLYRKFWRTEDGTHKLSLQAKASQVAALRRTSEILETKAHPVWNCYGLHEWAMLYGGADRKQDLPLRISRSLLDEVVATPGALRCTHFDAFRFFAEDAKPMNQLQTLGRATHAAEQPACVHYNMDLFKFALRVTPFIPSELLADALDVALTARTLDLRASPYDLSSLRDSTNFDLDPVPVETSQGRKLYTDLQADILRKATPVRRQLAQAYADLSQRLDHEEGPREKETRLLGHDDKKAQISHEMSL